jgi:ankyrin repeat protein
MWFFGPNIFDAIANGEVEKVRDILERSTKALQRRKDGFSPLHHAVHYAAQERDLTMRRRRLDIVKLLLEKGADPNDREESRGRTPLHMAAEYGDIELVDLLIRYRADVNAPDRDRNTPLHYAVMRGHKHVAEFLLKNRANSNAQNKDGRTPLHIAALNNNIELVQLLLRYGANPQKRDAAGKTPINLTTNEELARLLKREYRARPRGAYRVEVRNTATGRDIPVQPPPPHATPTYGALHHRSQPREQLPPLHDAAMNRNPGLLNLLLSKGSNPNEVDNRGRTPLHIAAGVGCRDCADLLIQAGADINARDKNGRAPLHYAVWYGRLAVADLLLRKGAAPDAIDNKVKTPLHYAVEKIRPDLVELLLQHGADPNVRGTKKGVTPLYLAVAIIEDVSKGEISADLKDVLRMIDLLLEKEDPNIPNIDGWTPLHKAAKAGAVDVVAKLLERHANPNATDKKGRTPLHIAASNGHGAVVKLLLQYGADICARDYRRRTPHALATGDAKRELELILKKKGFINC